MATSYINYDRLLTLFLELLRINAPSRCEGAIAHRVTEMLTSLGAEVIEDSAGRTLAGETGNLIARLPGTLNAPTLLFCAHLDTVEPTDKLVVTTGEDTIISDGHTILGADDKAGIAAIIEMVYAVRESGIPYPPLELVFTIAEEIGLMGSQVMDYPLLQATAGFIPDSSGAPGLIVTRAPAQKHLSIIIRGKAAHAGMSPEQGINAITVAARAIANIRQGRIDDETTANIGIIKGGKATNIIPDYVRVEAEARSRDPEKLAKQVSEMTAIFNVEAERAHAEIEIEIADVYPAFNLGEDNYPLRLASKAAASLGITPEVTATGGGSDANFFNEHGIATVILSSGYKSAHSFEETLYISQFIQLAEWLFEIVRCAGAGE